MCRGILGPGKADRIAGNYGGRAGGDGLPASDAERDDARERARGLWAGAAYLEGG